MKRNRWELIKRYILFLVSLLILSLGVALTQKSGLGVTPIASVANVVSIQFPIFTLGNWMIICNCLLIAAQVLLLRKKLKPISWLQIPVSFLYGYFTDFSVFLLSPLNIERYPIRLFFLLLGSAIVALGIALMVTADVIMNIGESFVKAVSDISRRDFGSIKILFDLSCVLLSAALSLVFFDFKLVGIREGTVFIATATGPLTKICIHHLAPPINRFLCGKSCKKAESPAL